jgi:hypothetical protein
MAKGLMDVFLLDSLERGFALVVLLILEEVEVGVEVIELWINVLFVDSLVRRSVICAVVLLLLLKVVLEMESSNGADLVDSMETGFASRVKLVKDVVLDLERPLLFVDSEEINFSMFLAAAATILLTVVVMVVGGVI